MIEYDNQFKLAEVRKSPDDEYLDNLVLLGRIAAVFGDLLGELSPSEHTALREISSPDYSRYSTTGFKVTVGFLVHPDPLWRIQNHDYPAIWLNKKGWRYGNFDKPVSASGIDIKLKPDGLTSLTVNNHAGTRREYEEALRYEEPEELLENVEGITKTVQYKLACESYVTLRGYPESVDPKAKRLLNVTSREAINNFLATVNPDISLLP